MLVYLTSGPHIRGLAKLPACRAGCHSRLDTPRSAICAENGTRTTAVTSSWSAPLAGQNFLKGSNATSARATTPPGQIDQSSGKRRHTPTSAEEFSLSGPSDLPDPDFNAYREKSPRCSGREGHRFPLCRTAGLQGSRSFGAAQRAVRGFGGKPRAQGQRAIRNAGRQPWLGLGLCREGAPGRLRKKRRTFRRLGREPLAAVPAITHICPRCRRIAYHFATFAWCSANVSAKTCPPVPSATKYRALVSAG